MAEIKCVMWNCSGLLPTSSAEEKMKFLLQTQPSFDILVLLETHHKKREDILPYLHIYSKNFTLIHTEADEGDAYGGIAILVSNKFILSQENVLLAGRILNLKLQNGVETYNITAFYGYTGNNVSLLKMKQMIDALLTQHNTSDINMILGDFNFVENDLDRTNKKKLGMNQTDKMLASVWAEFTDKIDLSDPFRVRNPKKRMFSYIHTKDNSKSRLDRVYVNEEKCDNIFHYKHTSTPYIKAHKILSFTLKEQNKRGPGYWKMNTRVVFDHAYSNLVEKCYGDVMALGIKDPIERWLVFTETIRLETQVYCSKKRFMEKRIKILCEKKIESLEQSPLLSTNEDLQKEYEYFSTTLNSWHISQIEGHQIRTKTQPKFEYGEPEISFFADLEKKYAAKKSIQQLKDGKGEAKHDTDDILQISSQFYTDLFKAKKTDTKLAHKLLQNINKKMKDSDKTKLDKNITLEELEKAVMKLKKGKSPGPDGIPAEFYQAHWSSIQDMYFEFINEIKSKFIPQEKNASFTTLIFKERGDPFLLVNYRPIALMNVDIKILSKVLSIRLVTVLPSIIHETQTAVYGRRIGNSIHLVRDIIDLANNNNEEAALIFLDQEKAFDRVSHEFLFQVLKKFGCGDPFINWIKILYHNASTRINVNGFFTDEIPLKSGVRQGCPLSPLLYVLVIEILALQMRANPNIVGFSVNGEKIISSHYADDAVIKITQNRCFKEVYKELQDYERASGAKINFSKSRGLWLGRWRDRTDDPFDHFYSNPRECIKWTNKNVKYLGIYVGNDNPALKTFSEIIPRLKRGLNFWKPLKLPLLAKSRVIEIYHASKLWYATNFYSLPTSLENEIDEAFIEYVIYPKKKNQISRKEMEKLREYGGIKLMNTKLKSETPKVHWLIQLITDENLKLHRHIFNAIIGIQSGHLTGEEIIFAEASYVKKHLRTTNSFYKEALGAITRLYTWKHVDDLKNEHLFYNPIFTTTVEGDMHDTAIKPFKGNKTLAKIKTYGDLLLAENTEINPRLLAVIRRKKDTIHHIRENEDSNVIIGLNDGKKVKFSNITQKIIYSELIHEQSTDHSYKTKWIAEYKELGIIEWDKVWESIHQGFFTEKVKSTIWDQVHLNFYTTYSYNKWHNTLQPCPLCCRIPDDIFHLIIDCKFTRTMWRRVEKILCQITPEKPTIHEKAFGLQLGNEKNDKRNTAVTLRNWITFTMRHFIMVEERKAFKTKCPPVKAMQKYFIRFNYYLKDELKTKKLVYNYRNMSHKFEKIATVNNAIATIEGGEYEWKDIM